MQAMARMERRDSDADSVEGVCTDNRSGGRQAKVRLNASPPTLMAGTGRKEG